MIPTECQNSQNLLLSDLQQMLSERDGDGFGAIGGANSGADLLDVSLDTIERDAEMRGDRLADSGDFESEPIHLAGYCLTSFA